jgi:cytochrome d ubiquinol oxidase subunit I
MSMELLSRAQFAFTITFHILYPAFSIGLLSYIAFFEAIWLKTRDTRYLSVCKFWTKILALTFGMGIVSGIVMEFQLGTNWANYTHASGNVLGVLFTYEVLTAFFIEAGFLGVMFFGWNRVSPQLHFVATLLALAGVTISAFWIMSANSWMQAPAGVSYDNGTFNVISWSEAIFNPMFLPRFFHMLIATYISTYMTIMAISAYYLLKNRFIGFAKTCFVSALWLLIVLIPLQFLIGDEVGLRVFENQPIKTAAIEGAWNTQQGAPLLLFAIPDQTQETNHFEIGIPKLASLINTHKWNGELIGLKSVAPADRPYVPFVFFSFRIMVGLWAVMFIQVLFGLIFYFRNTLFNHPLYLKSCIITAPIGFLSIITGWFTAEFGRQPWVIYHYLRTSAAVSNHVALGHVVISLLSIIITYGIIFGYFYFHYFLKIINAGPSDTIDEDDETFFYLSPVIGEHPKRS